MTKNIKFNKKTRSKTTTALTSLIGAVLLFNQTANAATSGANMSVTTTVGAYCTVTATDLTFATFANDSASALSTGGGVVSTNCSIGTVQTLSVTTSQAAGVYTMSTGNNSDATKRITFNLRSATGISGGFPISESVDFATGTGTAQTVAVSTLFGHITASQSGKVAGAYTTSIALLATFN